MTVEPIAVRLDSANARALVRPYDVVLDGSDNFATRYALSDACYFERRPLVTAALGEFDGTLTVLKPYETAPDGKPNPTYRCLFPDPPEPGTIPTCAEAGVLGAIGGVMGSLMAIEAIRAIVGGFGHGDAGLVGRLLMIDLKAMRFETLRYDWDGRIRSAAPGARRPPALRPAFRVRGEDPRAPAPLSHGKMEAAERRKGRVRRRGHSRYCSKLRRGEKRCRQPATSIRATAISIRWSRPDGARRTGRRSSSRRDAALGATTSSAASGRFGAIAPPCR